MKQIFTFLIFFLCLLNIGFIQKFYGQAPAALPYNQNFDTNDFTFVNGTQTNKWAFGAATGNPANAIYISNNNGTSNNYTITATSVVHAYRDIAIPAGITLATPARLEFNWKADGQDNRDLMTVWLVPANFTPVAGTKITAGGGRLLIGNNLFDKATWQQFLNDNVNISSFAGSSMRIVFEWENNNSQGTAPPAAVDNLKIRICDTTTPVVTVMNVTHNTAVLTWDQDLGKASYTVRYRPSGTNVWTTLPVPAVPVPGINTVTLNNLLSFTDYEVEVAAVCELGTGVYSQNRFMTRCNPSPPAVTVDNITFSSALVTWNPVVMGATYVLRWREAGTAVWNTPALAPPPSNTYLLQNLNPITNYEVQVANICDGETVQNPWSFPVIFRTERTCEMAPTGLTITKHTPTTAEVVWDPYPGATYILRYKKVGIPSWTTVPVATNNYKITGLLELTQYEMQVANICNGVAGNFTLHYIFTTPTVTYCEMSSANAAEEFISKVTVKPEGKPEMINDSMGSTYTNYTGDPEKLIELIQGSKDNEISIEKSWTGNTNDEGVAVWIDFDRNGTFDLNERIVASAPDAKSPVTARFSVPEDAYVSMSESKYVVMRVAMQRDMIPVNCTSFADGEVEDYTVRITKKPFVNTLNQDDVIIYPNPVSSILNVKNISLKAKYKMYSASGQLISDGIILNNKIDVSKLINGVYLIDIEDNNQTVRKKFIKEHR